MSSRYNRSPREQAGVTLAPLDEVLANADVLSINLVLSDETRSFLNAERIAKLKPGCIFVNTARGALVDEAAMMDALRSGTSAMPRWTFFTTSRCRRITR